MLYRIYLIDDNVFFRTSDAVIWTISDENEVLNLGIVQGRILEHLLCNAGRVVSRDELLSAVWENYGLRPSNASLNQNISILRKNLIEHGVDEKTIQTLPRLGYIIDESKVQKIEKDSLESKYASPSLMRNKTLKSLIFCLLFILISSVFIFSLTKLKKTNNYDEIPDIKLYHIAKINDCDILSTKKGSIELNERRIKFASKLIGNKNCRDNSFYIISVDSPVLLRNEYYRYFLGHCYRQQEDSELLSGCDTIYERGHEK